MKLFWKWNSNFYDRLNFQIFNIKVKFSVVENGLHILTTDPFNEIVLKWKKKFTLIFLFIVFSSIVVFMTNKIISQFNIYLIVYYKKFSQVKGKKKLILTIAMGLHFIGVYSSIPLKLSEACDAIYSWLVASAWIGLTCKIRWGHPLFS